MVWGSFQGGFRTVPGLLGMSPGRMVPSQFAGEYTGHMHLGSQQRQWAFPCNSAPNPEATPFVCFFSMVEAEGEFLSAVLLGAPRFSVRWAAPSCETLRFLCFFFWGGWVAFRIDYPKRCPGFLYVLFSWGEKVEGPFQINSQFCYGARFVSPGVQAAGPNRPGLGPQQDGWIWTACSWSLGNPKLGGSQPGPLAFLVLSGWISAFHPLKVKLLAGDLRTAQKRKPGIRGGSFSGHHQ